MTTYQHLNPAQHRREESQSLRPFFFQISRLRVQDADIPRISFNIWVFFLKVFWCACFNSRICQADFFFLVVVLDLKLLIRMASVCNKRTTLERLLKITRNSKLSGLL